MKKKIHQNPKLQVKKKSFLKVFCKYSFHGDREMTIDLFEGRQNIQRLFL